MLRTITLKNFVHFKDKTVIQLTTSNIPANPNRNRKKKTEKSQNGTDYCNSLNIFVGANFCGKSTIIELIRRCMTHEINLLKTKSYDNESVAYVFCKFNGLDQKNDEVFSGIIKEPQRPGDRVEKLFKIFIYIENNEVVLRSISLHTGKTYYGVLNHRYLKEIRSLEDEAADERDNRITKLLEMIKSLNYKRCCSEIRNKPSWKDIEDRFIATFPLRGIGIVQWTKSKNIRVKRNYKSACERAEVLSTLLTQKHRDQIDEELEREIFNFLTSPEVFRFKHKSDGHIFVQHNNSEEFPLLKTSEGILEAKMTSLLLANDKVKTLCLEDAERGMHPQMIERLKTILCREGRNKTIIVVTHSPYFIDTITVKNTHVFFRKTTDDSNSYFCSVRNVANCSAVSNVSSIELLRTLLFATKVLLVEGPTDREVVQGIFTQWKRNMIKSSENKIEDMYKDITTYQVVFLNGCRNSKNVLSFCRQINLQCLCILDLDVFVKSRVQNDTKVIYKFENLNHLSESTFQNYVGKELSEFSRSEDSKLLSESMESNDDTFVWRDGALEDMIRSSISSTELCDILGCKNTESKEIKDKLKTSISEENGELFYEQLENAAEIQRLIKFILDKEITRFEENELESDEYLSEQKCCNVYNVLRITLVVVVLLFVLFFSFWFYFKKYFSWNLPCTM